ncbi:hypothetical protein EKN56_10555 [Limnobaculum zhutongyuii]|uniref:Uncharacterized protein n=1 Tax=Limnobaculum zhutongyuii TaxID=2498113 RepID=A0A411WKQ9_9GAMM|nr:hypothetical protein [Limnobaculum zhutongyuii]QBH96809.1 hypothetical protein EKN56_10555 [Limnobaculum zhutongyuii]TQS90160.1 hypothetical protein ELQ32_02035 [Limnobaculum zhutongyuii]
MKSRNTNSLGNQQTEPTNWYLLREGYSKAQWLPVLLSCPVEAAIESAATLYQLDQNELCYLGKPVSGQSYRAVIDADDIIEHIREGLSHYLVVGDAQTECDLRLNQQVELEGLLADWLDEQCPLRGLSFEEMVSFRILTPDTCNAMSVEIIPL